uniref:At1g61320/AtMIF1 LRR domain-containing protein n=1 Tax=Triticum aestivum TaxID=4565 RepID=A0A077S5H7_WHEAT|nr:unnamed protein product [Triticum aestivum]
MAIQASAVSRQWRHLLHQRSRLLMNVGDFRNSKRTVDQVMATYTDATLKLLSPLTCKCRRTIKTLQLSFYLTEPYISSIGHAVGDVVKSGITEHLEFAIYAEIWVKPENPEQLSPIFGKLRDVDLCNIFAECDLSWILFILEAAPSLEKFYSSRHPCELNKSEDSAERTNLVWQTSNFKHLNLKLLVIQGFEEEDMVMNYIRLVMERAVGLKRIELHDKRQCSKCNALNLGSKFPSDEASKEWIRQQLTYSFSSSIEIVFKE